MRAFLALFVFALALAATPAEAHQDPEVSGYVPVPGGEIWYRINGRQHLGKKAALIAIHGGPGGHHRRLMPLVSLADERPVILYDQLGSGNSTRTDRPDLWTVERFVAEIDALRRALGLQQVIVLGHSWGGALAAEYAVRNPLGLRGVILSSPLISTRQWMTDTARLVDELPPHTRDAIRRHVAMRDYSGPGYREAEKAYDLRHACRGTPCPGEKYRVDGPKGNDAIYEYMWGPTEFEASGTLRNFDVSARLPEIRVPALMICGEFDEATPASCRKFAAMIASAPVVIIPGASHMSMVENEFNYLAAVRKFLRDTGL